MLRCNNFCSLLRSRILITKLVLWSIELDQAIRTTAELTRLKSNFLANVTHELRTPLNAIINYIGFVVDEDTGPLNEEQSIYLSQALENSENLLQIINNILDMSKIEAGQMKLNIRPVNLTEVATELIPLINMMLENKSVRLITEIAPELPLLCGDRLRIRQIMLNILSNAAKFTHAGLIHLKLYSNNGNIIIQVTDTGVGITQEVLPTIFEQFISADLTDQGQYFGPGLSMPITKTLVELHQGKVEVESQETRGTTFTVTLPLNHYEEC